MNKQTPGPILHDKAQHALISTGWRPDYAEEGEPGSLISLHGACAGEDVDANLALFAAGYTAFDAAARELGVDAVKLAQSLDLAEVIRYALDYAQLHSTAQDKQNVGRLDQVEHARTTLRGVAELMGVDL